MAVPVRRTAVTVLAAAMLAGMCACRPKSADEPRKGAGFIAVVGGGRADPLWPVLQAAALRFAELVPSPPVRALAPEAISPNLQLRMLGALRDDGMLGVCIQVLDAEAVAAELESLRADGVAVVTMMRRVDSQTPFLHSGIDPGAVGAALAEALADQLPQGGTLGVLHHDGRDFFRLRHRGFQRRIATLPGLTVLRDLDCGGSPATAVELMRQVTERFPGIDGWAAMGTWPLDHPDDGRPLLPANCALVVPGPLADLGGEVSTGRCRAVVVADYSAIVTRALGMCRTVLEKEIVQVRTYEAPPRAVTRETLGAFQRDWASWAAGPAVPPQAAGP